MASHESSLLKNELFSTIQGWDNLKMTTGPTVSLETVVAALHCMAIIGPSS